MEKEDTFPIWAVINKEKKEIIDMDGHKIMSND